MDNADVDGRLDDYWAFAWLWLKIKNLAVAVFRVPVNSVWHFEFLGLSCGTNRKLLLAAIMDVASMNVASVDVATVYGRF